jgi:hypothetical protein
VFRYFVLVDNFPLAVWDAPNQLLKYWPNQTGVRYPDRDRQRPVRYAINADGWNSAHASYAIARTAKRRIAVVGDSYVEAFQVQPAEAVASQLEGLLGPARVEVYSFGISGAPLSQYLHIARYVARTYRPDLIVVVLVHNDFLESYQVARAPFAASFLHVDPGDLVREVPPQPYDRRPLAQWMLARSATLRFGFYLWRGVAAARPAPAAGSPEGRLEANVDVTGLTAEKARLERAAAYMFGQFAELQRAASTSILFVMDTPREALPDGRDPASLDVYALNRLAQSSAQVAGLPLVDLTRAFVADYARNGTSFEFRTDNHWNAYAHALVARELARVVSGPGG